MLGRFNAVQRGFIAWFYLFIIGTIYIRDLVGKNQDV